MPTRTLTMIYPIMIQPEGRTGLSLSCRYFPAIGGTFRTWCEAISSARGQLHEALLDLVKEEDGSAGGDDSGRGGAAGGAVSRKNFRKLDDGSFYFIGGQPRTHEVLIAVELSLDI